MIKNQQNDTELNSDLKNVCKEMDSIPIQLESCLDTRIPMLVLSESEDDEVVVRLKCEWAKVETDDLEKNMDNIKDFLNYL